MNYDPRAIEPKWQASWGEHPPFAAAIDPERPKFYVLGPLLPASLSTLDLGHARRCIATDIISRYKRMRGFNVLHPIGWDGFGVPLMPADARARVRQQLERLAISYDWGRELDTAEPTYAAWTRRIFVETHANGGDGELLAHGEAISVPSWAGRAWAHLRFCDPTSAAEPWSHDAEHHWMPVDLVIGDDEHGAPDVLASRRLHAALFERGYVSQPEPFARHVSLGGAHGDANVAVDELVARHGADATRIHAMWPLEGGAHCEVRAPVDAHRLLQALHRVFFDASAERLRPFVAGEGSPRQRTLLHRTIAEVTEALDRCAFSAAIVSLARFVHEVRGSHEEEPIGHDAAEQVCVLMAPFAPHLAAELWAALGHAGALAFEPWPAADDALLPEETLF